MRIIFFTVLALLAFAGNSVICRFALDHQWIDPFSFTVIRLISGALALLVLLMLRRIITQKENKGLLESAKGSWLASLFLFIYAIAFSVAYQYLDTGVGAFILFASGQFAMILGSMYLGERLRWMELIGFTLAMLGFVLLVYPILSTPSVIGFILMTLAGTAWAFYSIAGRASQDSLADTAFNFMRSLPFALLVGLAFYDQWSWRLEGILLAILSGAVTSGVGYAIWYSVLPYMKGIQAAVVQLSVPVIAALGGVLLLDEILTLHLMTASFLIISGIILVVSHKSKKN